MTGTVLPNQRIHPMRLAPQQSAVKRALRLDFWRGKLPRTRRAGDARPVPAALRSPPPHVGGGLSAGTGQMWHAL